LPKKGCNVPSNPFQTDRISTIYSTNERLTMSQLKALQDLQQFMKNAPITKTKLSMPSLAQPLLDHQVTGCQFALDNRTVLIADEQGVGKTATAIAIATASVNAGMTPVLIVVPPSMRLQWAREFAKFSPTVSVHTITGTNPVKHKITELPKADVLLIGDASLAGWKNLLKHNVAGIIVDECQRIKGGKRAKRSQACVEIAKTVSTSGIRVAMSGTPLVAHPMELLPVVEMLDRGATFKGGINGFINRYAPKIDAFGSRGAAHVKELHDLLTGSFMIRRVRSEVLTLPNKGRTQVTIEMDEKRVANYIACEENLIEWIRNTKGEVRAQKAMLAEALVRINELRHICAMGSVKPVIKYVENLLDDGEQVFMSTNFKDEADAYFAHFAESHNAVRIVGGMTDKAKMEAVDAFQSGHARVLIGNVQSAGTGITLHSARHHVSCSLSWTSADLLQVEDRINRFGQTRETVSHIMVAGIEGMTTMDEKMLMLIEAKNKVMIGVLEGTSNDLISEDNESMAMAILRSYS
jgi:SNF2 family DNA or RNA helicase